MSKENNHPNTSEKVSQPWGKLTSTSPDYENVALKKVKYTMGTSEKADISIHGNKILPIHCELVFNKTKNTAYIEDFSTTGTFVNDE